MADISQVKEITAKLETGVKELFESDKYLDYLKTMSRFHQYSTRNTLLIHLQMPGATQVAGYNSWKNKFERQVKKGEKGIKIFAPIAFKVNEEKEKLDPETNQPILDENGMPVTEQSEKTFARFKVTSVFDVSQTDGKPLPSLAENIMGNVRNYELFMDTLRVVSPLPIVFKKLEGCDGECRFGENITINEGMSEIQTVCAVIHEITHAKLHDRQMLADNDEKLKSHRTEEVEAESVSYAVCQYYGIETNANSFGYIAEWSKTHELKELNASLDTIRKAVAELIDGIDERYLALAKERGIDLTVQSSSIQTELEIFAKTERLPLLDEYANAKNDWLIGSNVMLMPVFDDLNFNRTGKKIRVKVEEPAGKYQLFSQDRNGEETLYFMTASGRITRTAEYFNSEWDAEKRKHVNHRPTEAELDEVIPKIAEAFEKSLAEPTKWALYQHAAVVNRIDECDAHNIPVRKLRDEERAQRHEAAEKERQAAEQQKQEKYDNRIGEIATAIKEGKTIDVAYDQYEFGGKNPVLDLFKLYGISLPLRTQGWVNTGLAEITESSYRYYSGKHKGNSTTFIGYLQKLRQAVKETPIEQKQRKTDNRTEVENILEQKLYEKFSELFPQIINKEYSYMRLEAQGFEPLSLEWIFGDRISIMHTYTMNGDLMYDPMIEFSVNSDAKTMTAVSFEQSMPPLYQRVDENGSGQSIDGNGKEWESPNLQKEINDFAAQWLQNLEEQNHIPVKATLWNDGDIDDVDVRITFDKDGNPIMPELEKPATTEPDIQMPDPSIGISEMNLYGYTYAEMLPLTTDKALELWDGNCLIYLLHPDGTEGMANDRDEIKGFDGLFGIECDDWKRHLDSQTVQLTEGSKEADLLYGNENRFGIYQVKNGDDFRDYCFESSEELKTRGLSVIRGNYELVYTAPLPEPIETLKDRLPALNKIYETFNTVHPDDYTGRSVSISDVIVLKYDNYISSHYVDKTGFTSLAGFLGDENQTAIIVDDSALSQVGTRSQPTVAELKADAKAGKTISLTDLAKATHAEHKETVTKGKPSIMERLEANKERARSGGGQHVQKNNELEV